MLLTYLTICFMNNWRGGWTIGPRYLAGIVPLLAWPAAFGLSRWFQTQPRSATVMSVAALLTALVASGLASAYYPHIPPEITRPLSQLLPILIAHDYAPNTAASWIGVYGTASMVPIAVVSLVAVVHIVRGDVWPRAVANLFAGAALAFAALFALSYSGEAAPPYDAIALITRTWNPKGHDAASQLEQEAERAASIDTYDQLIALYLEEGRQAEAQHTQRRRDARVAETNE